MIQENKRVLVKNAADPEQVAEAEKKEKAGRDRDLDDIRFVMSTKQGRRFLWRLLESCRLFQISHSQNPYDTSFFEGMRNAGQPFYIDAIDADLNLYLLMTKEGRGEK